MGQMRTPELLEKLLDIERSIGIEDNTAIRNKLIELEEDVLLMQRAKVETLRTISTSFSFDSQSTSVVLTSSDRPPRVS
jgi:hypothetical protein